MKKVILLWTMIVMAFLQIALPNCRQMSLVSHRCITCQTGFVLTNNGTCKLLVRHVEQLLECPTGSSLVNGRCICNSGYALVNGICVLQPPICHSGYTLVNGICVLRCGSGQILANGVCICDTGYVLVNDACVDRGSINIFPPSILPNCLQHANGNLKCLRCDTNYKINDEGHCQCSGQYSLQNGQCIDWRANATPISIFPTPTPTPTPTPYNQPQPTYNQPQPTYNQPIPLPNQSQPIIQPIGYPQYTDNNQQNTNKASSNQENTQVIFSKSGAEAEQNGDIRPDMRQNWPPTQQNNPRLLQAINWNQAVQWVYSTTAAQNRIWLTYFQTIFFNDCPRQAYVTLKIESTGPMWVYVNGIYYRFSYGSNVEYITFPVKCGTNVIETFVCNLCCRSGGIKFQILQNYCYSCSNTLTGFYNRQTCQCECIQNCHCTNPLGWAGYPSCSCRCPFKQNCNKPKQWNPRKCKCQCPPISCHPGLAPNAQSCTCTRVCNSNTYCSPGSEWSLTQCRCVPCIGQCPYGTQFKSGCSQCWPI